KAKSYEPEILLQTLLELDFGKFFLTRLGVSAERLSTALHGKQHPSDIIQTNSFDSILRTAATYAERSGRKTLEFGDIFLTTASLSSGFRNFLHELKLEPKDLEYVVMWYQWARAHETPAFLAKFSSSIGIGKTWAFAFTPLLDTFSRTITINPSEDEFLHFVAHQQEISLLEEALAKSADANALLVGEAGVGKMSIVKGFVRKINHGYSLGNLNYKKAVQLRIEQIYGQKTFGDTAGLLTSVLKEASLAGNIIIVIDEIQNYISSHSQTNISEILIPFLKSSSIKIVGLTNQAGVGRGVLENQQINTLFERIDVREPDEKTVMKILMDAASHTEEKTGLFATYPAIKKIYRLSEQYISDLPFPEKAIMLFEDAVVYVRNGGFGKAIMEEHVEKVLERKLQLPVGDIEKNEAVRLINLEDELHRRIIDQEEAILGIADAMRRSRTGVTSGAKPIGSFLFLGPTGVGKTETAKALAEIYFGGEKRMIRFDMSEFQKVSDLARLIGSPEMKEPGVMALQVRENPFSLVLLDEIEKASPDILNLFLQVFDEGHCTDAFGKRVDFRNTIIIGTSNAEAEFIRASLAENLPYTELQKSLIEKILKDAIFRPEFINRFDKVVVFKPLSHEDTEKVAKLLLRGLGKRLQKQGYEFAISDETVKRIASAAEGSVFGGRELRRIIQDTIESPLAKDLLLEKYKKGDSIEL
ncbi:MAG: ATP-dependent Clp protease ATP-binding subunit, partial [Candidatus Sungbacteria bacterium]|nr:ATP-dependent Clp protease ATP-binding subunit [Candidatus Sungbacteria bacterium]